MCPCDTDPRPIADEADPVLAELARHARATRDDRRVLKLALTAAVTFHVGLLAVRLPAEDHPPPPDATTVRVPPIVHFVPPRPVEPEAVVRRPPVRVPIPDATPDEPEPVREPPVDLVLPPPGLATVPFQVEPPPPPAPPAPVDVDRIGVERPVKIFSVDPVYPEMARRAGTSGLVILEIVVDTRGTVSDVRILRGAPLGLTDAAVAAVRQWRYEPLRVNGVTREALFRITVAFSLVRP